MLPCPLFTRLIRASHEERWAPLPTGPEDEFAWAAPVYYVSTLGRVATVSTERKRFALKALRKMERRGRRPHLRCNLHVRKVHRSGGGATDRAVYVHRLVAATWADQIGGVLVRHLNGDGCDNRIANLLYGTHSENLRDQYELRERGPADYDDTGLGYTPDLYLGF